MTEKNIQNTNEKSPFKKRFKAFLETDTAVNLLYVPAILLFLVFVVYPFISGIRLSFTNWNGFSQSYDYIGFRNYTAMFQDSNFYRALINTFIYGIGSTIFQQILGLGYAILLTKAFLGRNVFRTLIYLPVLIAAVVMGYMWTFLIKYDGGAINDIIVGLGGDPINVLASGNQTMFVIILINVLQFVGVSMLIYIAGLQSIPEVYYEAASIDGASKWQQFKTITIPLLMPSITTSVIYNLIGGLKLFDVIVAVTGLGNRAVDSLSTFVRYKYSGNQQAGYSSTVGLALFVVILVVSILLQRYFARKEVY